MELQEGCEPYLAELIAQVGGGVARLKERQDVWATASLHLSDATAAEAAAARRIDTGQKYRLSPPLKQVK